MQSDAVIVRDLESADHAAVLAIYNHYIVTSPCTFDTKTFTTQARQGWFDHFKQPAFDCLVASVNDQVVGYACTMPFKPKPAYSTSLEVSVYVDAQSASKGIGRRLYQALLAIAANKAHRLYAGITLPNQASVALHSHFGFQQVGLYTEVGFKFDQFWDVAWFEKSLGNTSGNHTPEK